MIRARCLKTSETNISILRYGLRRLEFGLDRISYQVAGWNGVQKNTKRVRGLVASELEALVFGALAVSGISGDLGAGAVLTRAEA